MDKEEGLPTEIENKEDRGRAWLDKVHRNNERLNKWREKGWKVVKRYRSQKQEAGYYDIDYEHRFNLHWANTDLLLSSVLARLPEPVVTRRWKDKNQLGLQAAEILERALRFSIAEYDFDQKLDGAALDFANPGLGQLIVRYRPTFIDSPEPVPLEVTEDVDGSLVYYNGEEEVAADAVEDVPGLGPAVIENVPEKAYEEVYCDLVRWDKFGWCTDCADWDAMPYCYVEWDLTKDEFEQNYPDFTGKVRYTLEQKNTQGEPDYERVGGPIERKTRVYEIYDKINRRFLVVSKYVDGVIIEEKEDPWGLEGFYPFPRPLFSVVSTDNLIPVPFYMIAQDLYDELDKTEQRIVELVDMLRVRGYYDAQASELNDILSGENGFLAAVENFAKYDQMNHEPMKIVTPFPEIVAALQQLQVHRRDVKEQLFELYGFSDLMRGATRASETKGAQELKAQYTGLRFSRPAKKIQKFARDVIKIMGEMIAEHFDPETLSRIASKEVSEEHISMIRDQVVRTYTIDVNTDSMMVENEQFEMERATSLVNAMAQIFGQMYEPLNAGLVDPELAKQLLLNVVRKDRKARELERAIEEMTFNGPALMQVLMMALQQLPPEVGGQLVSQLPPGMQEKVAPYLNQQPGPETEEVAGGQAPVEAA